MGGEKDGVITLQSVGRCEITSFVWLRNTDIDEEETFSQSPVVLVLLPGDH